MGKRKRNPEQFDLAQLTQATSGYTGADIEQVVIAALKLAFHAGSELKTDHLLAAVSDVRPLAQTDPERVAAITEWLERHTRAAGGEPVLGDSPSGNGRPRRRRVAV